MKAEIIEQKPLSEGAALFINNDKTVVIIGKKYDDGKKIEGLIIFSKEHSSEIGSYYVDFDSRDFEIFMGKIELSNG